MKTVIAMFVAVAAFAAMSAADEIQFPSSKYDLISNTPANTPIGFIAKDPTRNILWLGGGNFDLNINAGSNTGLNGQSGVDFDKNHDAWLAMQKGGLIHKFVSGTSKTYGTADGLPSGFVWAVKFDSLNNRLIVGTDSGVSIIKLDVNENPVSFTNTLSVTIQTVDFSGVNVYAVNTSHVYWFDGTTWMKFDSTNSPVLKVCFSGCIDKAGNFYVATSGTSAQSNNLSLVIKFDPKAKAWSSSSIDARAISNDIGGVEQIKIDRNNQLWMTYNDYFLIQYDLTTGTVVGKSPLYGKNPSEAASQYKWLDERLCGGEPALGLMKDGSIIIGANGVVVIGKGADAVVTPRQNVRANLSEKSFGLFDVSGRRLNSKTFSNSASGIRVSVVVASGGLKSAKTLFYR